MQEMTNFPTFLSIWKSLTAPRVKRPPLRRGNGTKNLKSKIIKFDLEGALYTGSSGNFAINGEDFIMDEQTWVFGNLANGAHATVQGIYKKSGERYATKIVVK